MRKEKERDYDKQERRIGRREAEDQKPPIDNPHHEGMPAHQRRVLNANSTLEDYLNDPNGSRPRIKLRSTANGGGRR